MDCHRGRIKPIRLDRIRCHVKIYSPEVTNLPRFLSLITKTPLNGATGCVAVGQAWGVSVNCYKIEGFFEMI